MFHNIETLKPVPTLWSIQGDVIYRHHTEPRVQLHVQKEERFRIPLKYTAVTDLHVLQEKKLDYNWNVDSRGFTKFTLLKEKPPNGHT